MRILILKKELERGMIDMISLDGNDMFSYFRGIDLQDLIIYILNTKIIYRDRLGLSAGVTFGPEIEFEKVSQELVDLYLKSVNSSFSCDCDGSLNGGGEFNSFIMRDDVGYWNILKCVCSYLKSKHVDTDHNAGGHIHVGAHVLGSDVNAWRNFIKLYICYECVLFRFFYGDKINGRKKIMKYAPPIADILYKNISNYEKTKDFRCFLFSLPMEKHQAVSFWHVDIEHADEIRKGNTIEFRIPNGTVEYIIWQNSINVCSKMLCSSKSGLDEEFLNYKLANERISSSSDFCLYQEVLLRNCLEFVDLVFNNNLDKIYFLKQYLKDFESGYRGQYSRKKRKLF